MELRCDPADPDLPARLVELFTPLAGRSARLVITVGEAQRVIDGRVPLLREWPAPDHPCLLVPPGATGGIHVLSPMALHLLVHQGRLVLARRRWYEEEPLDFEVLGSAAVDVRLEPATPG
jgi:hypothetical protein